MFSKSSKTGTAERIYEEALYEQVFVELSNGFKREGLWAKAIAESDGVETKAKSLYLKYRVQSLKDEAEIEVQLERAEAARRAERARRDAEEKHKEEHSRKKTQEEGDSLRKQRNPIERFLIFLVTTVFIIGALFCGLITLVGLAEHEYQMAAIGLLFTGVCSYAAHAICKDTGTTRVNWVDNTKEK